MIQLTFHDLSGAPAVVLETTDFRITGGVLWKHEEHGLIASFASGTWKHRGTSYPSIFIAGGCCLAFGILRESLISDPIPLLSITGTTLRANGVAIAEYEEKQDHWQGLIRPSTWQAMRVISAAAASALAEPTKSAVFNPWDYPIALRPPETSS